MMYIVIVVLIAIAVSFGMWATIHVDKKIPD